MEQHLRILILSGWLGLAGAAPVRAQGDASVGLSIDRASPGVAIPADFVGLSFETASEPPDGYGVRGYFFDPSNQEAVILFRELGLKSLRLGGGTVDRSHRPIPTPTDIDHVFAFARAADVRVIYSFRLQHGSVAGAAALAAYIWSHYREQLDCFAIGNEPDWHAYHSAPGHLVDELIFETEPGVPGSAYPSFLARWRVFADAIALACPGAKFEGPSTGSNYPVTGAKDTDYRGKSWTVQFAHDERNTGRLAYVAQHNYVGQDAPKHTPAEMIDLMLSPGWVTREYPALFQAVNVPARAEGFGCRLMESNSFSGAVPRGSNAFATALWSLDYLHWWAAHGCAGINFHNKQWQENDTIYQDAERHLQVYPMGYGIKAFSLGGGGRELPVTVENPGGVNLTAYAVRTKGGLIVTVINKEHGLGARSVRIALGDAGPRSVMFLRSALGGAAATQGVTLGGAPILNAGPWAGKWSALPPGPIEVPASSAAIVRLQ